MIITGRNNAPISIFGGDFRCKSEYLWCIIEVKSKHFPTLFKKIEKNKKKITEKRETMTTVSGKKVNLVGTLGDQNAEKNQKKMTEKREFLRKTSFRSNRFFYMVVIQKLITVNS
ncbi:Uncharacterized protein FWK35_00027685, partial [Aphis craccivora]